jgi:RNA polymerase sigma-70 factor (ECF subfamily)
MTSVDEPDTEELLGRTAAGDRTAMDRLLARHRKRHRQMVAIRMDPRLAARADPSDIVQEALMDAAGKLAGYLRDRPMPFYPWLRQLAWERLLQLHRRHLRAQTRTVTREERHDLGLSDQSVLALARRLVSTRSSPSEQLLRKERRVRVQFALSQLAPRDREVLVLRYLEQLPIKDIAAVLGVTEGAAQMRHLRAVQRLRDLLGNEMDENSH